MIEAAGDSPSLRAWLQEHFPELRVSADVLLVAREGEQLCGVVAGAVRPDSDGIPVGHVAFVGVVPSQRRRGVGRALVRQLAVTLGGERLTTRYCDVSPFPGVPESAADFFAALDFVPSTRECTMRAPAAGALDAAIHLLKPAQLPSLNRLIAAELVPNWSSMLADREVVVVEEAGEVIGFAAFKSSSPRSYFGPMGVAVHARRRGLGRALTLHALARLAEAGAGEVELWTDYDSFLGRTFYPSMGFRVTDVWHNFELHKR